MQGHADGCSYTHQFSDDVRFDTPGWAEAFAYVLDANGGFGTVGANDTNNPGSTLVAHSTLPCLLWSVQDLKRPKGKCSSLFQE
jgi:hypothetical protein